MCNVCSFFELEAVYIEANSPFLGVWSEGSNLEKDEISHKDKFAAEQRACGGLNGSP